MKNISFLLILFCLQSSVFSQTELDSLFSTWENEKISDSLRAFALTDYIYQGFFSRWQYVKKSKDVLKKEKDRSESLLLNILPAEIAKELKEKGEAKARDFDLVSILFTDFKGFT